MEAKRMVLNRPRTESATKAPTSGKSEVTATQVLTFLAAVAVGSWSFLVKYMIKFPFKP